MILFVVLLLLFILINIKAKGRNEFFDDYCAPKQTATINGIFTLLIFISHSSEYVQLNSALDKPYVSFKGYLGQLVVVSFLFFSGFGIMESIKKKGDAYVKSIPTKRLFRVWYHFAIAIVLYIVLNFALSNYYPVKAILLSFTGITAVGNSNWYMLVTFVLYIIVFVSFMISRKSNTLGVILVCAITVAFAYFEYKTGLPSRYYNTIMCFPAGMVFSQIKPYFDKIVTKNDGFWIGSFGVVILIYCIFSHKRDDSVIYYAIWSILAVFVMMMFTMKVKIGNKILDWFGSHVFSIFILQRLPMMALKALHFNEYKYPFIIVSFAITALLAIAFDKAVDKLDNLIYNRKKQIDKQ